MYMIHKYEVNPETADRVSSFYGRHKRNKYLDLNGLVHTCWKRNVPTYSNVIKKKVYIKPYSCKADFVQSA